MKCPKCGLVQEESLECNGCGVIIAMFLKRNATPVPKTRRPATKKTQYGFLVLEKELRDYYQAQLVMLGAGLSAIDASKNFLKDPGRIKDLLPYRHIADALENGMPISEGMSRAGNYFPAHHTQLMKAGESTGDPAEMFDQLFQMIDQKIRTTEIIIKELRKPALTLLASIFILPVPVIFSDGLVAYLRSSLLPFFYILIIILIGSQLIRTIMKTPKIGLPIDKSLLAIPLINQFHLTKFIRVFRSLYAAGVSSADAFSIAAEASNNLYLHGVLVSCQPAIAGGTSIRDVARESGVFPSDLLQVMGTAEASGTLDKALARYVVTADEDFAIRIKRFSALFSIIVGALVSLYVGYRIISRMSGLLG